jgi:CBS domain-containing protein
LDNQTRIPPFSLLPENARTELFKHFSYETHPAGTIVLTQEISRVEKLYIVSEGAVEIYFEESFAKTLQQRLAPHDHYGGISILMNDGVSTRTMAVVEESVFMTLEASLFLDICRQYEAFQDYFAAQFGKCMLNRSYAGIILRHIRDKEFNLPFFNQPIAAMHRPNILTIDGESSIQSAAEKMSRAGSSAILIKGAGKQIEGIVTDADFKTRVLGKGVPATEPVRTIMSSPVATIQADEQVFEAFINMSAKDKRHLVVTNQSGHMVGIVAEKDLIVAQTNATSLLIRSIKSAAHINQLKGFHSRLTELLLEPIKNGSNPEYITKLITAFSEAILDRVIGFAIDELGEPPCKFAFMIMGSEGRDEQTLISDQDNALVFEDIEDDAGFTAAKAYFARFSESVCSMLNTAGFKFCDGNNMAMNPKWCQPLSVWKDYFSNWVRSIDPEKTLYSSIFFDFRGAWGELALTDELKSFLLSSINESRGILRCLTENSLQFKPPVSFFGKFVVEEKGKHKGSFDIKKILLPVIDFARIHALKEGIASTNTLTRLYRLYTKHRLTSGQYLNLIRSYNYLMNLRFLRQITTIMDEEEEPDNFINPSNLSTLDQAVLKEIFKIIERLQQKLKMEFIGAT